MRQTFQELGEIDFRKEEKRNVFFLFRLLFSLSLSIFQNRIFFQGKIFYLCPLDAFQTDDGWHNLPISATIC